VVLGGGGFAAEKASSLLEAGARVRVVSARLNPALETLIANGSIESIRRDYQSGDLAGARLVIDASEDERINRLSWQEAEAADILINVVDRRRELRERRAPLAEQTRTYHRLLTSDVRNLLRAGRAAEANHLAAALSQTHAGRAGCVALVGAGPGDPDLLTVKARDLLADADFVLHDALIAPETLAMCGPNAKLEAVGKRGGHKSAQQNDITARLIHLGRAGYFVVRLKGGDPFVFGRGGEELDQLVRAGIEVVVVPGITSALAAPAAMRIPVTMRGVASSVVITTVQGSSSMGRLHDLALACDTIVVLMSRTNLPHVAAVLARAVGGSRAAAVISNATLPNERRVSGPLARIALLADQAEIAAPAVLVVGDVVDAVPALAAIRTPDSFEFNGAGQP
jgi:uroporphyrin-III C-methyltransferase/precorrin-2 dehydrogenase/sirohydrochlorin ferrochelatase